MSHDGQTLDVQKVPSTALRAVPLPGKYRGGFQMVPEIVTVKTGP